MVKIYFLMVNMLVIPFFLVNISILENGAEFLLLL